MRVTHLRNGGQHDGRLADIAQRRQVHIVAPVKRERISGTRVQAVELLRQQIAIIVPEHELPEHVERILLQRDACISRRRSQVGQVFRFFLKH